MKHAISVALMLPLLLALDLYAQATVRVTQETDAGLGNFNSNVLGYVNVFDRSSESAAAVYNYDCAGCTPAASYNGVDRPVVPGASQLFFVRTAEGVSLFAVHGGPGSGSVWSVQMRFVLSGDPDGAQRLVEDDPGDMQNAGSSFGPFEFQIHHRFWGTRTDGVVVGSLEGLWSILVSFTDVDGSVGNEAVGITSWIAASAGGSTIPLALVVDRRVRLEAVLPIGIKPQYGINPKSRGTIPVAIPSTPAFNAPLAVNQGTLTFGRTGEENSLAFCTPHSQGSDDGGLPDLVCHFYAERTGFQTGDAIGVLRGETMIGVPFEGRSPVRIVPNK